MSLFILFSLLLEPFCIIVWVFLHCGLLLLCWSCSFCIVVNVFLPCYLLLWHCCLVFLCCYLFLLLMLNFYFCYVGWLLLLLVDSSCCVTWFLLLLLCPFVLLFGSFCCCLVFILVMLVGSFCSWLVLLCYSSPLAIKALFVVFFFPCWYLVLLVVLFDSFLN